MDLSLKAEEKLRIGPAHRRGGSFLYGNKIQNQHSQFLSLPHKNNSQFNSTQNQSNHTSFNTNPPNTQILRNPNIPLAKPVGEIRRLSEKELQAKREKGLCFRCDEKWSINHRCKRRELSVLLTQEEEEGELLEENGERGEGFVVMEDSGADPLQTKVSLNLVMGITNPKTMKLLGKVNGVEAVVMVDPGPLTTSYPLIW